MLAAVFLLLASIDVPSEVRAFVPKGHVAIAVERGDLDRDGKQDYVVVVQRTASEEEPEALAGEPRTLLVLTRQANGKLKVARKGPQAVLCPGCGGVFGDPFDSVVVEPGRFTIRHYGGSNWRWTRNFTFAWSRRDRTWQLVRAEETSFHTGEPAKVETTVHTPPKDFGKIDLAEFDPFEYLGKGAK